MVTRGVLRSATETGGRFRSLVVSLFADSPDDVDEFQPWGLATSPPVGSDALVLASSGNAEHLVALIAGASGLGLAAGESALYNAHGWSVQLKEDSIDFVLNGIVRARIDATTIYLGEPTGFLTAVARVGDLTVSGGAITGPPGPPNLTVMVK